MKVPLIKSQKYAIFDFLFYPLLLHTLFVWVTFRDALIHFFSLFPPVL